MNQICAYTERPLKPIEYITDFENSKTVQNVTFSTKKLVAEENQENMAILQKLSTALPKYKKLSKLLRKKRETFLYILFDAAKKLNIENLISVENNVINLPNNAKKTRIEWKLYFKNILISCVQKKSFKKCEFAVVNSAIFKLKHLFNFKIINNELKKSDKIKKLKFISENDPSIHIPCTRKHSTQIDSSLNHKIKVEPLDIHCDTKIISENDPSIHIPCKRKHSTQIDSSLNHKIKVEPLDIHCDTKIISENDPSIHIPCKRKHSTQIDSSLNHKIKVEPLDIHCDTKIISENDPSIHIPCKRKHSTQIDSSLNHKIKVEPLDIHCDTKIISENDPSIHIPCKRKHSTQIDSSLNHKIKVEPLDIHCDTKIISENDPSIHIPYRGIHSTQIDSSLNHKIKVEPLDIHSDNTKIISHSELAIQEMSNIPKNIFILNTYLFNSSMKDGFLLLINRPETKHPRLVLSESAILCKIKFEYKMEDMSEEYSPKFKLYAMLNNVVVGTAIDFTIPKAKGKACENAINILRKKYYIIRLKNQFGSADIMNCSDLTAFGYDLLPATKDLINGNIDFRMLIKCTKDDLEDSVCDDVKPVISEESLDYNKAKKKIVKNIWKKQIKHLGDKIDPILKNFRQTNLFNDLVFQHGFGHGERKEIHRVASKHGLLVHTNKLNNKRYTIVSHKYSAIQILDHLVKIGGSNNKYELVDLSKDEYF